MLYPPVVADDVKMSCISGELNDAYSHSIIIIVSDLTYFVSVYAY